MVRLISRTAFNRHIRSKNIWIFDLQKLSYYGGCKKNGGCKQRVVARIISKLRDLLLQPNSISDMAEPLSKFTYDAEEAEVQRPPRRTPNLGW